MEGQRDGEKEESANFVREFLSARSPIFRELAELRARGWANKKDGDEHFKHQRQRADHAGGKERFRFFNMMQQIGDELHNATGALSLTGISPQVLDLCMAPGGYTASALKHSPHAHVWGITLPEEEGGHKLIVNRGPKDPRVEVAQLDITMLSAEFGASEIKIAEDHPDKLKFLPDHRPYLDKSFDLVFCDGQVLRTHIRSTYRERKEALRLTRSQLIFAMQRVRLGGTIIILLHKVDAWESVKLLFQFNSFARIQLFKPKKKHKLRSSFYLVATNVDPSHSVAVSAVAGWKDDWREATFAYDTDSVEAEKGRAGKLDEETHVLSEFGSKLIELGEPIWAIQRDALRNVAWTSVGSTEDSYY